MVGCDMSCGGREDKLWVCGQAGAAVNFQRVGSIVRDIGEPCLSQSPIKVVIAYILGWAVDLDDLLPLPWRKDFFTRGTCLHEFLLSYNGVSVDIVQVNKMLKPEKWQATFDSDGKIFGFQKALKLIVVGGIDPSIRPEVWEFLLGCYALGSTAEYRKQLRTARRERYENLVKHCQMMHASIGTGSLAYVVGSKIMDMRAVSNDNARREPQTGSRQASVYNTNRVENNCDRNNDCIDTSYACQSESSSDSADLISVRVSTESAQNDSSCFIPTSSSYSVSTLNLKREADQSECVTDSYFDFPPLPVTDLFGKTEGDKREGDMHDGKLSSQQKLRFKNDKMHSFQINNNVDLVMESNPPSIASNPPSIASNPSNSEIEMVHAEVHEPILHSNNMDSRTELVNRMRISDVSGTEFINRTSFQGGVVNEDKVSEWRWTLHRIVVDVVRTDCHLEFYENTRNLARMSDILAVYAWVDPATGYCQGMSDLLSPFVVLFEDDADAFWCFEMLIRRMRDNFQMEGPTGVMKQLQALWNILELTDREIFAHLSRIGAESLHFAFRMLLVLFRRELSFSEALCMWEMMWAADFDEAMAYNLEENCLEALMVQLPRDSETEMRDENAESVNGEMKGGLQQNHGNIDHSLSDNEGMKSASSHHFCGLTRSFWSRNDQMQICAAVSSTKKEQDELPVFCVAAILIMNRQKIIRETHSIDDMIKIFNDNMLKFKVRRCIRNAIKLRKKYFYKLIKRKSLASPSAD